MNFDLDEFLKYAIAEDVGDGDHTSLSTIPSDAKGRARLLVKDQGIIAGIDIAKRVFELIDSEIKFEQVLNDGDQVKFGDVAFYVEGRSQSIVTAERLALNIMQRMSGIATQTHKMVQLMEGTKCKLLDTRKTTPGFRYFEKLAVKLGGGVNHRIGLYDMILVKDNHIDYAGGVHEALHLIKNYLKEKNKDLKIEVEARSLEDVKLILKEKIAFRILLDNFTPEQIKEAVDFINGEVETEASGGINETNLRAYAEAGVDYISMGALTHQIKSLDLSLKAV
ncbi:MAG: carboxylating nicotinate-nucleotide diphosphorylase [Flavobacteriales bacterium]